MLVSFITPVLGDWGYYYFTEKTRAQRSGSWPGGAVIWSETRSRIFPQGKVNSNPSLWWLHVGKEPIHCWVCPLLCPEAWCQTSCRSHFGLLLAIWARANFEIWGGKLP